MSTGVDYHLVLADARAKRDALDRLISALEALTGTPPVPVLPAAQPAEEAREVPPPRPSPAAPRKKRSHGDRDDGELRAKAIAELKKSHGSLKPGELYRRLDVLPVDGRALVAALLKDKRVTVTGNTTTRVVTLA